MVTLRAAAPPRRRGKATWRGIKPFWLLGGLILLWALITSFVPGAKTMAGSPAELFAATLTQVQSGALLQNVLASLQRVAIGYIIAIAVGVTLGLAFGSSRRMERMFGSLVDGIRAIPPIAWTPLAILWFGIGNGPAVFLVAVAAFGPIFINVYTGVTRVASRFREVSLVLGIKSKSWLYLTSVLLPSVLPSLLTGLRLSAGYAWAAIVAAELISASSGVGYMLAAGQRNLQFGLVLLGMVVIALLGYLLNFLFLAIERRWANHDTAH
jgi:ABC-type nitrate/sulfonate/bicarbonate transport system permease component